MVVDGHKIYVAKLGGNTVSVIDGSNDTVIKQILVGLKPHFILVAPFPDNSNPYLALIIDKVLVLGSDTVSVIDPYNDTNEQNITIQNGYGWMDVDSPLKVQYQNFGIYPSKLYLSNPDNTTVSVIDVYGQGGRYFKKEPNDIVVGQDPGPIAINPKTRMVYVGNSGTDTVSVINGFSSKLAAGVRLNVNPFDSGTVMCDYQEYPTNVYIYIDNGTRCAGQPRTNNFEFDHWIQNLNRDSSLPVNESSGYLTVDRYGNFTASFRPTPPQATIPPDFLYGVILGPTVGAVLGGILGWYIPYLMNKRTANKEDINKSKEKKGEA